MNNLRAVLFLSLLQAVSILTVEENTNTEVLALASTDKPYISEILPLVVILLPAHLHTRPTILKKTEWTNENDKILAGGTNFSIPKGMRNIQVKKMYMCAMGTFKKTYRKPTTWHNDDYCTYWTNYEKKEALRCEFEPEPFVEMVNISLEPRKSHEHLSCGLNQRGKMYRFAYKTCLTTIPIENYNVLQSKFNTLLFNPIIQRDSYEIYRFCYDEENKEVIYTKHNINSIQLLFHSNLEKERKKKFQMISDGFAYFESHYRDIEKDFIELERSQEKFNTENEATKLLYQVIKFTSHEDFEFALWRKTTYHYLNVRPMENNQAVLWNYMHTLILEDARKNRRKYDFRTGVFTLPENRNKAPILGKISTPDIWLKFIGYTYHYLIPGSEDSNVGYDGIVIIMNTNYGNSSVDTYFNNICEKNFCRKSIEEVFSNEVIKTMACCRVTKKILNFFDSTAVIRNVLKINLLTDEIEETVEKTDTKVPNEKLEPPSKKHRTEDSTEDH